jgi:hypothetical protein
MSSEDEFYASYKYAWSEKSDGTLQDFLTKASLQVVRKTFKLLTAVRY